MTPAPHPRVSEHPRVTGRAARTITLGWPQTLGSVAAGVAAGAMVATPLMPRGGPARRLLATVVVAALATTTASRAAVRWGGARTAGAVAAVAGGTLLVEGVGSRTGLPFGRYAYTGALRPQLGGVPALVPLAWFAMALPAREAARAALGARATVAGRIVGGAAALTAWDVFLDPQMVGEGYWRWQDRGAYRGIPATNFLGWFLTGLGVMTVLDVLLPPEPVPDAVLVGEYAAMGVMETVGFGAFFGDRVVATAGGAAMLPLAGLAARRLWSWRHWRMHP
jgi:uncharacterized membrane protein